MERQSVWESMVTFLLSSQTPSSRQAAGPRAALAHLGDRRAGDGVGRARKAPRARPGQRPPPKPARGPVLTPAAPRLPVPVAAVRACGSALHPPVCRPRLFRTWVPRAVCTSSCGPGVSAMPLGAGPPWTQGPRGSRLAQVCRLGRRPWLPEA